MYIYYTVHDEMFTNKSLPLAVLTGRECMDLLLLSNLLSFHARDRLMWIAMTSAAHVTTRVPPPTIKAIPPGPSLFFLCPLSLCEG